MLSRVYPDSEKKDKVKSIVLAQLDQGRTAGGEIVLLMVSGETYSCDATGEWRISKLSTTTDETGRTVAESNMRLPAQAPGKLLAAAHLPFEPDAFVEEAFEDHGDKLCVCRQIAALTKRSLMSVCDAFDNILDDGGAWRDVGITGEQLKQFCVLHGHPLFFSASGCLVHLYEPREETGRALAVV